MASIAKRGGSYRFTVSCGYGIDGRQRQKTKTWKPPASMSPARAEKEAHRLAVLFEEECRCGEVAEGHIKLSAFIHEQWLPNFVELEGTLKERTIQGYHQMLPRIEAALGHLYLDRITPEQLLRFYRSLYGGGVRQDGKQHPTPAFTAAFEAKGLRASELAELAGVSLGTVNAARRGNNVSHACAEQLAQALSLPTEQIFEPTQAARPLSASTVRKYHNVLSSMLSRAVRWGYLHDNPCERVEPPKSPHQEAEHLDEGQARRLLELLDEQPEKYRVMIHLLLFTGMRRGELLGLEWSDVDFERELLHIRRTSQYTPERGIYTDTTKTANSQRAVKLSGSLIALLKTWKAHQAQERLKLGDRWSAAWTDQPRLFTQWDGKLMHPDTLSKWFSHFIKSTDLPPIHLHSLRHTNASLLIAAGAPVTSVANRLGHSSTATTTKTYSHAIQSANEAAAQMAEDILHPIQKHA